MHRHPQFTVQSSLMKSSTTENTVCLFQTVVFWVVTLYNQEVTRGTVNFHLQNSHDGVIFHKSTVRLKILYLSILSVRWSGWYRQYSGLLRAGCWMVQCSNPGEDEIFNIYPDQSRGPPSFLYNAYCVCSRHKATGVWQLPTTPF